MFYLFTNKNGLPSFESQSQEKLIEDYLNYRVDGSCSEIEKIEEHDEDGKVLSTIHLNLDSELEELRNIIRQEKQGIKEIKSDIKKFK
jgi:hypothetical protein